MILSKITHRKNWTWTASSHLSRGYLISVDIWSRHETSSNIPRFSNWKSQILGISSTRQFASPCMLQIFEAQEHVDLFSCYDCQNCCQQHLAPQNACLRVSVCLSWPHASLWSSGDRRTLLPDCPRKNCDPAAGLHGWMPCASNFSWLNVKKHVRTFLPRDLMLVFTVSNSQLLATYCFFGGFGVLGWTVRNIYPRLFLIWWVLTQTCTYIFSFVLHAQLSNILRKTCKYWNWKQYMYIYIYYIIFMYIHGWIQIALGIESAELPKLADLVT